MTKILISVISFLQIVLGPTLVGGFIGFFIYNSRTDATGLAIAIIVLASGFIGGLIWAIKVSKKKDPADYVSQVNSSPDLNGGNPDFFHRP